MENEAKDVGPSARPKPSIRKRCCSWGLGWKTLLWLAITTVYVLFGGLIFTLAERPNEVDTVNTAVAQREELTQLLQEGTEAVMAAMMAANNTMTAKEAGELVERVVNVSASLALSSQVLQAERSPLWTYSPSVFFSTTVVTTIGYGSTAPVTALGRTLFIFYAIIGIPIFLIFLKQVGEWLSNHINSITKYVAQRMKTRPAKHQATLQGITVLILFISGLILLFFFPALIFRRIEDWTYGEAVYYCFVTLTTVGFGDFVPAQTSESEILSFYRICSAAWIIVGLAWVALLIADVQNTIEKIEPLLGSLVRKVKEKRAVKRQQNCLSDLQPPNGQSTVTT